MKSKKTGFTSVGEYIGSLPPDAQKVMKEIRAAIKQVVPEAREKISYQIACFELNGRNLVHYAGWKNHVSMYPTPDGTEAFNTAIAKYAGGKGTTKFPLDKPLPLKLIRQIVKYRMMDNIRDQKAKAPSPRSPLRDASRSPKGRGSANKKEKK